MIHETILGLLIALFIIYFTIASFARYDNFYTGRYDLGNMTQTVWNTAKGRIFQQTNPDGIDTVSRLAFHADFILVLFAPFYWIWESPKVLLLAQSVIVGMGAIFVYLLSEKLIRNKTISLAFSFSYLINPALGWATLFDFHPVVLATTFLLGATYFLIKKQYSWFLGFAFLAALTKEQVWLILALFGPVLFIFHKKRLLGFSIFIISLIMFYFLIWHAIPWAASSEGHFAMSYFENESNPTDLLKNVILYPGGTIATILLEDRIAYLKSLFIPLGYLPILFPFWLIFSGADFVLNLLSDKSELHQIYYHYSATITPFLFLAGIYAAYYLKKYLSCLPFRTGSSTAKRSLRASGSPNRKCEYVTNIIISIYTIFFALYGAYIYGPLSFSLEPNVEMFTNQLEHRKEFDTILKEIPVESSVASSNELGAQLSHRENIYTLGIDITDADYVAFFMRDPDMSEVEFNTQLVLQLRSDPNYEQWYQKYGLVIFKKIMVL